MSTECAKNSGEKTIDKLGGQMIDFRNFTPRVAVAPGRVYPGAGFHIPLLP